jgi:transposase InsO family protein
VIAGDRATAGAWVGNVHLCIDDASRIADAEIKKSERKASAITFLKAAVIYSAKLGISIQRVMTDNGSCYKSRAFGRACKRLGLKHIRTRPYTPNGKAERFIQTAQAYQRSDHRGANFRSGCIATIGTSPWQYRCQAAHQQTRSNRGLRLRRGLRCDCVSAD